MKGQIFSESLVYQIDIRGESWIQGQTIQGELLIKNQSNQEQRLPEQKIGVALATGEFKKVQAEAAAALKLVQAQALRLDEEGESSPQLLQPQQELVLPFSFVLEQNCLITDKKGSYYLSYGPDLRASYLQLIVNPRPLFLQIAECVERFHRFRIKEVARGVVYKMVPPASREFANIDSLELLLQSEGKDLHLQFTFSLKKITVSSSVTKMNKEKSQFSFQLTPREYSLGSDGVSLDQEKILALIQDVLQKVKLKIF